LEKIKQVFRNIDLMENKKRIADKEMYNDSKYHKEPKEYFKLILSKINFIFNNNEKIKPTKIIDVGGANGALLSFLKKDYPNLEMQCYEPLDTLIEIGRKLDSSIKFENYSLFDIPNLEEEKKADVVISCGVIGIFKNPEKFLSHILKLGKKKSTILILSPFNEEPIDVILKYKYSKNDFWETGHNLFSIETMKQIASKFNLDFGEEDFKMPFQIDKTDDPMRSWTESFRGNNHHIIYGTNMFSTVKLLIFRKP